MSGHGEKKKDGNTHPSYDEKNRQLAHSRNYQDFARFSNGDMDHQPNDDINRHSYSHPRSHGDFNRQKFDEINRRPYHGDIDHRTYYDEKTRRLLHERKYNQIDEYTHPKYGHINDQNYQGTYFDEHTRHLLHSQKYNQFDEYTHPRYGHIHDQNYDRRIDKPIPSKFLTPSDILPSQYTARDSNFSNEYTFSKTGEKNPLPVTLFDKKHHQYQKRKDEFNRQKSISLGDIHHQNISVERYQNEINRSSPDYFQWKNKGILNASKKGNPNCHENFSKDIITIEESNSCFNHPKTKRSTNSSIHNSRPTKKAHEVQNSSETFIFSNPLYRNYHPLIIPHEIGVCNPIFDRRIIPSKYLNQVLGIRQGILFHKNNIFIFSPILQNDIVSNLMSVIYQEYNCHSSIVQLTSEKERKKQLKKEVSTLAYKVMNTKGIHTLNCSDFLQKNGFLKEKFTNTSTFNILVERFETISVMIYHDMPVQRMKKPGKNCAWIKDMTRLEVLIIQDNRFSICSEKLENYLKNLGDIEEKCNTSFTNTNDNLPNKNGQTTVYEIEEETEKKSTISDINKNMSKESLTSLKDHSIIEKPDESILDSNQLVKYLETVRPNKNPTKIGKTSKISQPKNHPKKNLNIERKLTETCNVMKKQDAVKISRQNENPNRVIEMSENEDEKHKEKKGNTVEISPKIDNKITDLEYAEDEMDGAILAELNDCLETSSQDYGSLEDDIPSIPPTLSRRTLYDYGLTYDEIITVERTIVELQLTDWSTGNNIQANNMDLLTIIGSDNLESYLPDEYWTSTEYKHVLVDKKVPVIHQVVKQLESWKPESKDSDKTFESPPKDHIYSFMYVLSYSILWDSGFQHHTFRQLKGKTTEDCSVINFCPIHHVFKTSWNIFHFAVGKSPGNEKHPIPYCDCKSDSNTTFCKLMKSKGKNCIYHYAAYQYLLLMYGDPATSSNLEVMQCANDNDEIEIVQVVPASQMEEKEDELRKETELELLKQPIPKKKRKETSTTPTKALTMRQKGRFK